jgi:hypothetical protein
MSGLPFKLCLKPRLTTILEDATGNPLVFSAGSSLRFPPQDRSPLLKPD